MRKYSFKPMTMRKLDINMEKSVFEPHLTPYRKFKLTVINDLNIRTKT